MWYLPTSGVRLLRHISSQVLLCNCMQELCLILYQSSIIWNKGIFPFHHLQVEKETSRYFGPFSYNLIRCSATMTMIQTEAQCSQWLIQVIKAMAAFFLLCGRRQSQQRIAAANLFIMCANPSCNPVTFSVVLYEYICVLINAKKKKNKNLKVNEALESFFFLPRFPWEIIAVLCLCRAASFVRCLFPGSPAGKPHLQPTHDRIVPQPLTEKACVCACVCDCERYTNVLALHPVRGSVCVYMCVRQRQSRS